MRLPRCRLRTLMVVVAVAGIVLGAGIGMHRRSWSLWHIARSHGERAFFLAVDDTEDDAQFTRNQALYDYRFRLMRKYAAAARYPWLPVAPDPPEP
jgi:hypothetical protein